MTKVNQTKSNSKYSINKSENKAAFLDKLAQLCQVPKTGACRDAKNDINKLKKRARSKYMTNSYTVQLAKLKSPLQKSYNNTIYGCSSTLIQDDNKITTSYCGNRWCLVCNRIRTAKMINAYMPVFEEMKDKVFLTLTIPNVKGDFLREAIKNMTKTFRLIQKYTKAKGLRKLECTYNPIRNDYHPHFHFVLENDSQAQEILLEWLKRYPNSNKAAQDVRKCTDSSVYELFKYFTKIIVSDKCIYIKNLDVIFQAMRNLRVYQPFGGIKKVSEDIDEIEAEEYEDLSKNNKIWQWFEKDWVDTETGETLTGYEPDENLKTLFKEKMKY
jgi:hypothetical protein